jgi:hypothetical protein
MTNVRRLERDVVRRQRAELPLLRPDVRGRYFGRGREEQAVEALLPG